MLFLITLLLEVSGNLIWESFSLVAGVAYFSLELSCLLGYVIVRNSVTFFKTVLQVITGFLKLLHVLIEDYSVFITDLGITLFSVLTTFQQWAESVLYLVISGCCFLYSFVSAIGQFFTDILSGIFNAIYSVISFVISLYMLFKETCLFVGASVWSLVTGIPDFLCLMFNSCVHILIKGIILLQDGIYKVIESILEFPVKPVCGLVIAMLFGCVVIKNKESVLNFAYRTWLTSVTKSQRLFLSGWQTFEGFVLWLLTNQTRDRRRMALGDGAFDNIDPARFQELSESETDTDSESEDCDTVEPKLPAVLKKCSRAAEDASEENDIRSCVVCQDKVRNTVILPCRHVCLCSSCCMAVRQQQGLCPLCRKEITYVGRVYL